MTEGPPAGVFPSPTDRKGSSHPPVKSQAVPVFKPSSSVPSGTWDHVGTSWSQGGGDPWALHGGRAQQESLHTAVRRKGQGAGVSKVP